MSGDETVMTSKQFVADFEAVAARYKLREFGEYEIAKAAARADMDGAMTTFSALAEDVRTGAA